MLAHGTELLVSIAVILLGIASILGSYAIVNLAKSIAALRTNIDRLRSEQNEG